LNFQNLYHLTNRGLVCGVPKIPHIKRLCHSCIIGKHHRQSFPKQHSTATTRLLQIVHSDLCGPMPVTSQSHYQYILTFIDDISWKTLLYFLFKKSQTFEKFKEFWTLVETSNRKIENLHSDRGKEYISHEFNNYCKQHGIQRNLTAGYSPQQNGVAERKNCTLLEGIRSIVIGTKIPSFLWDKIAHIVNYLQNRSPMR
jgi:hypothetical protein